MELRPVPVEGVLLVAFAEIEGLADTVGSIEKAVPEEAERVVALAEIEKLAEGSEEATAVPLVPTTELAE